MEGIFDSYEKKPKVQTIKGDFIDRLHGSVTIAFLFVIVLLVTIRQASHSSIKCWYLTSISGSQGGYIHQFCWINSTYHYPGQDDPTQFKSDNRVTIPYYQFMPFILIGQIFLFYLPSLIWKIMSANSSGYMNKMLDIGSTRSIKADDKEAIEFLQTFKTFKSKISKSKSITANNSFDDGSGSENSFNEKNGGDQPLYTIKEEGEKAEDLLANKEKQLNSFNTTATITIADSEQPTKLNRRQISMNSSEKSKTYKTSKSFRDRIITQKLIALNPIKGFKGITIKYFILKMLNLINAVGQIFLLNYIFGGDFLDYGIKYSRKLWYTQNPLFLTKQFPVFTLCDVYAHVPNAKIHENTIQCILGINVLLEKFFILIWFWLVVLSIITVWNLLSWIYEVLFASKAAFLYKYLMIFHHMNNENNRNVLFKTHYENESSESKGLISMQYPLINDIQAFQKNYLGLDGLIMLLLLKSAGGDVTFIKLLGLLWKDYKGELNNKLPDKPEAKSTI